MDRKSFGRLGSEGQHYIRLSIASDLAVLEDGVARLNEAGQDHEGINHFLDTRPDLQ